MKRTEPNRKLKAYRAEHNLSQKQMAEKLELSVTTYVRKENGQSSFTLRELQKIMEKLLLSNEEAAAIFFD